MELVERGAMVQVIGGPNAARSALTDELGFYSCLRSSTSSGRLVLSGTIRRLTIRIVGVGFDSRR